MSKNDGEARINFTGDSTKIIKELKEIENAFQNAARSVSDMLSALDGGERDNVFNDIAENAEKAESAVSETAEKLDGLANAVENAEKALGTAAAAINFLKAAENSRQGMDGGALLKRSEDFSSLLDDKAYMGNSGDMERLMKLFLSSDFSDIAAKVTSTVLSEQVRYSAPAYTAASAGAVPENASSGGKDKNDIAAILEKLNKPLPIMLDGKVIAEAVMTYQNNYMKGTGG